MDKKRTPGRPRVHDPGKWSSIQFRIPIELREKILKVLEQKNNQLAYRLSLNSLLLELITKGLETPEPPADKLEEPKSDDLLIK